jgi:negative regulator of sigma E activity
MPLEGEKLDELLSGFIDAELDESDLQLVAETLESDEAAQQRLEELRRMSREVREVGTQLVANAALPANFAERVLAAAERQAREGGFSRSHDVHHATRPQSTAVPFWRKPVAYAGLVASIAAMWLLAVYVPNVLKPKEASPIANAPDQSIAQNSTAQPAADTTEPLPPSVSYIGQDDFKVRFALLLDLQVTKNSVQDDIFGSILAAAGIDRVQPITVTPEVRGALAETRMIIQPGETQKTEDTLLYFLRSDPQVLDDALLAIWKDKLHFPNVRLDLAIDNPKSQLIEKIARSTGRRFAMDESFAAPIAVSNSDVEVLGGASPFPGSSANTKYVSRQSRDRGWTGSAPLAPGAQEKASMLVLLHIVD